MKPLFFYCGDIWSMHFMICRQMIEEIFALNKMNFEILISNCTISSCRMRDYFLTYSRFHWKYCISLILLLPKRQLWICFSTNLTNSYCYLELSYIIGITVIYKLNRLQLQISRLLSMKFSNHVYAYVHLF